MPFADAMRAPSSATSWLSWKPGLRPEYTMCSSPRIARFGILSCGEQRSADSKQEDWEPGSRSTGSRGRRGIKDEPVPTLHDRAPPVVTTIASQESVLATRLWRHAQELDQANSLATILLDGAVALKGMAMTACGADALLAPYIDTHDAYHRIKRERHSFAPHYNKALAEIAAGHAGHLRDILLKDLDEALAAADALRTETPLMRYVRRELADAPTSSDILLVLRLLKDTPYGCVEFRASNPTEKNTCPPVQNRLFGICAVTLNLSQPFTVSTGVTTRLFAGPECDQSAALSANPVAVLSRHACAKQSVTACALLLVDSAK